MQERNASLKVDVIDGRGNPKSICILRLFLSHLKKC